MILSTPCFEVWFRPHFNTDTGTWPNGDAAKAAIQKLWPDYRDRPDRHREQLRDRLHDAVDNAETVRRRHGVTEMPQPGMAPVLVEDRNASTNVDRLILDLFCGE